MSNVALKLTGVSKTFDRFTAVNNISLDISNGEIFGFLGPNGAGKTTTIKMIAGLLKQSSGNIHICGHDMDSEPAICRTLTGYIPDRPYLYEKLTGAEYLSFIASLYPSDPSLPPCLTRAEEYLRYFDIDKWKHHLIESYSHGMRQKLIMTSIFILDQPLIVVDEPMVGLDPKSARIVKELFIKKANEGKTIFLSTHSMEIAEQLCNRIAIISEGAIVATGSVDHLRQNSNAMQANLEDLFLQLTGAFELQEIIAALRNTNRPVSG